MSLVDAPGLPTQLDVVNPIVIGEYNDVPAPGSLVASAWAQKASRRTIHRFATVAERDTKYTAVQAGLGALCFTLDTSTLWEVAAGPVWIAVDHPQFFSVGARSAAFPSPARGQSSYMAAAGQEGPEYFNGVNWRKPWNMPWGMIGYALATQDHPNFGAALAAVNGMAANSVPCVGGRNIRVSAKITVMAKSAVGHPEMKLYVDGVDWGFLHRYSSLAIDNYITMQSVTFHGPTTGNHNFQIMAAIQGGGGMTVVSASVCNGSLIIEDMGPLNAGPAIELLSAEELAEYQATQLQAVMGGQTDGQVVEPEPEATPTPMRRRG